MPSIPPLSRRLFLRGTAASLAMPFLARLAPAQSRQRPPMAVPGQYSGEMRDGARHFDLKIADGETRFFDGVMTRTRGINGSYLGPVLALRADEDVVMNVKNALSEKTTLHWHGLNIPATADGGPHQIIPAGTTWSPAFKIREKAATMWFHSHLLGKTAEQVWQGIAGMMIIEDDQSDALALPRRYGVDDFALALQDRRFTRAGQMPYAPTRPDRMQGLTGNVPLVNGTVAPYLDVTTGLVRLRILNASNGSIYQLGFDDGRAFQMIASDGGLLAAPVEMTSILLAPAERAEIVVPMAASEATMLRAVLRGGMMGGGMMGGRGGGRAPSFDFLELRGAVRLTPSPAVPATLAAPDILPALQGLPTRRFELEMAMGPAMMLFGGGFRINGRAMKMSRINETVPMGQPEIWEITNTSPMAHPFHIHDTQFHILDRNGATPHPSEAGRKDTVLVNPRERVRILVRFDHYSDPKRPYMYHCHILEHEDGGMMGQFTVT